MKILCYKLLTNPSILFSTGPAQVIFEYISIPYIPFTEVTVSFLGTYKFLVMFRINKMYVLSRELQAIHSRVTLSFTLPLFARTGDLLLSSLVSIVLLNYLFLFQNHPT